MQAETRLSKPAILAELVPAPRAWHGPDLVEDDFKITLPAACLTELECIVAEQRKAPVPTLVLRPEHFSIGESCVEVRVVLVEPTGADTQVFCKLAGHNVSAISRERHTFRPGDTISLKPFEGKTYLFDPESGARIA